MSALPILLVSALAAVQDHIGRANAEKGFHGEGDALRAAAADPLNDQGTRAEYLRTYYSEKLLLIVSEVTEAHDELRKGRGMTETYYLPALVVGSEVGVGGETVTTYSQKPEGVPSELADVVIRCFDLADEADIDLAAIINEKLRYNATRPFKHGKKF